MDSWGNVGNDWEAQINAYISNLMRPRNQQAEYLQHLAGTSQNPGAYYQQLAAQVAQQAEQDPMRQAQIALIGNQSQKMGYEADLAHAQAQVEGRKAEAADPDFGIKYMKGGAMNAIIPYFGPDWGGGGGKGGGKGGGGIAAMPELTRQQQEAQNARALAEKDMYDKMVSSGSSGGYSYGPNNPNSPGYSFGGSPEASGYYPQYDPSTSSYGPSDGTDSWADIYNQNGVDMTGW